MAKVSLEIPILSFNAITTGITSDQRAELDPTDYSGSVTYYFEVNVTSTTTNSISLRRAGTTTNDATITEAGTGLKRIAFTPNTVATDYVVFVAGTGTTIDAARIIVVVDAFTTTTTQTFSGTSLVSTGPIYSYVGYADIGGGSQTSALTTLAPFSQAKYFYYDSSQNNGSPVYFEVVGKGGGSGASLNASIQESTDLTTWTSISPSITISSTSTVRTRSAALPLVSGRYYRVVFASASTMGTVTIYSARMVISNSTGVLTNPTYPIGSTNAFPAGLQFYGRGIACSYSPTVNQYVSSISFQTIGTAGGTPTDGIYIQIVTGSVSGTVIATSNTIIPSTTVGGTYQCTFSSPYLLLSSGTTYYIRIMRSGTRSTTNYFWIGVSSTSLVSGAVGYSNLTVTDTWISSTQLAIQVATTINFISTPVTKIYSEKNVSGYTSGSAANTNCYFVPSDYSGVTNTYYHAVDSPASVSGTRYLVASTVTLTGSTITDPSYYAISSSVTMPTSTDIITGTGTLSNANTYSQKIIIVSDLTSITTTTTTSVSPIYPQNPFYMVMD